MPNCTLHPSLHPVSPIAFSSQGSRKETRNGNAIPSSLSSRSRSGGRLVILSIENGCKVWKYRRRRSARRKSAGSTRCGSGSDSQDLCHEVTVKALLSFVHGYTLDLWSEPADRCVVDRTCQSTLRQPHVRYGRTVVHGSVHSGHVESIYLA